MNRAPTGASRGGCEGALLVWWGSDGRGVVGVVVEDLEEKEGVDGVGGGGVGSGDADRGAAGGFCEGVADLVFEAAHCGGAGRVGVVDEHGCLEVAVGEHFGDMGEVRADLVDGSFVGRVVGGDSDFAAVREKKEMMRGFLVREAHDVVAAGLHSLIVGVRLRLAGRRALETNSSKRTGLKTSPSNGTGLKARHYRR